jgi:hypothetical protein
MDTKSQLILQLLITFMMALPMSGTMTMLHHGITLTWLRLWPREFIPHGRLPLSFQWGSDGLRFSCFIKSDRSI